MQTPDKDRLDLWLDQALQQQGEIEPRAGLEGRLLARLRSREEDARAARKWILGLGSPVLAALLIVVIWRGERAGISPPNLTARNRISQSSPVKQAFEAKPRLLLPGLRNSKLAAAPQHRASTHAQPNQPRLPHFPSERALSEQEVVLAQYAESYPAEAALIAKEQQDFDQQIQKAQQEIETRPANSNE